ncbi:MAG TPA: hypothetical protein PLM72_09705, partial [Spirochaetota bacterium]|nr:hypothetical protein [Spirochaetota bacterium]
MNHLDYKIYSWDWSSYTDISDDVKDISNIPILAINPDQSPVFEGVTLKSIVDMTETGNEYLSVGKYIAVEIDGHKRYYGVVKSSYFDYESQLWNYSVNHYFQKLKDDTPTELSFYIQLYMSTPDVVEIATDLPAGYIDGNNVWQPDTLTYFEITIKGFLKAMIEGPGFLNMTAVFDLDTDKTTLLESFKISHKNLESWKSNYADYELEYNLYNMLDILVVILKIFGLKMYFSDTETITVSGNDTAPTFDTFTPADVNSYSKREKESEMLKQIYLQQKEFLIKDIIDPKNPDYYFSVGVLFSYNRVLDMIDSGDDLELTFALDHKLPTANNTMFTKLKMLGYNEGEIDQEQEEWSISDTDKIKLTGKALTEMRYSQTNVGDEFTLDSATITHTIANIAYSTIVATDIGLSLETLSITGCFTWFMLAFVQGSYTYETGSGNPSGAGKYRVQDDDTIIICKGGVSSQPQVANYLIENEGTA